MTTPPSLELWDSGFSHSPLPLLSWVTETPCQHINNQHWWRRDGNWDGMGVWVCPLYFYFLFFFLIEWMARRGLPFLPFPLGFNAVRRIISSSLCSFTTTDPSLTWNVRGGIFPLTNLCFEWWRGNTSTANHHLFTTHHLPSLKMELEGFLIHHNLLHQTEGICARHQPSLAQNTRWRVFMLTTTTPSCKSRDRGNSCPPPPPLSWIKRQRAFTSTTITTRRESNPTSLIYLHFNAKTPSFTSVLIAGSSLPILFNSISMPHPCIVEHVIS